MLAYQEYLDGLCDRCGGDLDETTDPANDDRYHHLPPAQCHRCVAYERAWKEYEDQPYPMTLMHRVKLRRGGSRG